MAKSVRVISTFHEPNPEARDFRSDDPPYPEDVILEIKQAALKLPLDKRPTWEELFPEKR